MPWVIENQREDNSKKVYSLYLGTSSVYDWFVSGSCDDVTCQSYEQCVILDSGRPSCICPPCLDKDQNSGPVCSNQLNTYSSLCALKTAACRQKSQERLESMGPCVKGEWEWLMLRVRRNALILPIQHTPLVNIIDHIIPFYKLWLH